MKGQNLQEDHKLLLTNKVKQTKPKRAYILFPFIHVYMVRCIHFYNPPERRLRTILWFNNCLVLISKRNTKDSTNWHW